MELPTSACHVERDPDLTQQGPCPRGGDLLAAGGVPVSTCSWAEARLLCSQIRESLRGVRLLGGLLVPVPNEGRAKSGGGGDSRSENEHFVP